MQLIEIYMGIGGLEFGSGVTRSPGLVFYLSSSSNDSVYLMFSILIVILSQYSLPFGTEKFPGTIHGKESMYYSGGCIVRS